MNAERVARAVAALGDIAERDVPLAPLTTYRLGGAAAVFVRAAEVAHLERVAAATAASDLPVVVIGRGSNLLVSDAGFAGIAVLSAGLGGEVAMAGRCTVAIGGGMALPVAARRLAAMGLRGFEWAVGVPGTIGGAVRMNAGGHGSDMASCVVDADVFDLGAGEVRRWSVAELGLRFRASALTDDHVVVSARIGVTPGDRKAAEAELAEIVRWRRENQPGGQNAGSVFVNPVPGEVSAGSLVDRLGLRGLRHGTAFVSEKHANFIQGSDGGSAEDVRELMALVREKVGAETGYRLRSEIRLIGFPGTIGGQGDG